MNDEKIWLVDEGNNRIKIVNRSDTKQGDIWRISAIWLFNNKNQVLVAQRAFGKNLHDGKWGPSAAGTVNASEEPLTNALKELEEEVGFKLNAPKLKLLKIILYKESDSTGRQAYWFAAKCNLREEEFVLQESEVATVKWISKKNLLTDIKLNPKKYVLDYKLTKKLFEEFNTKDLNL